LAKVELKGRHIFPDGFEARGESYVAEKMRAAYREEARKEPAPRQPDKKPGKPGQSAATKRLADKYIPDPDRKK
jgi:hypothetical protein